MKDKKRIQDGELPETEEQKAVVSKKEEKENKLARLFREEREKAAERHAQTDVIFSEPLHPAPAEEPKPLVKGSVDMWFLLISMLLVCFGAVMSYSASAVYAEQRYDDSTYFLWRYVIFTLIAAGITALFVVFARPWHWRIFAALAYAGAIVLLLVVLVVGGGDGVQRWIDLGFITIQPSEIAKMATVMMLALYMPMIIIGIICGLIALELHISGLMIVGMLGVAVMFLGGTRIRYLAMFVGIIAVAGVLLIAVSSYAQERVDIWLKLEELDPRGEAWQTLQGLYAIGSGSFFGLGLGSSRQKFGYVSQPQNDFIFTIICEELGFLGAFILILLFALLVWRGIIIGQRAPDKFCALTVWGLTFKIALQVAMNIAVVTNSMPNTGISLPFFSSGGSALILQVFEVGIILSISRFSTQKK